MEFRFNRRFLLTVGLIILSLTSWAQTFPLQIQVSVMPPYSAYLQDYPGTRQQVRVFIINTSRTTYQIRLTGQLTGDNGIEIRTSPNYRPPRPVTVPPGQTLLTRNDLEGLFDLNQIDVTGIDKNLLARGFPLPDGTYQLCVRAYNETATNTAAVAFGQALSPEFPLGCSAPIVIKSVEPPILISPLCDAEVTATNPQAVVFTWTPPAGVSPASVEYVLRVVELPQADVDPNVFIDAVALPKSGVEVRGLRTSTFLYGPTQPPLIVGKRYAWRVQAIDRSRKLNFLNDGKAPVCAFTYGTGLPIVAKKPGFELVQTPTTLLPVPGLFPAIDTPPAGATAVADMIPAKNNVLRDETVPVKCSCPAPQLTDKTVDNTNVLAANVRKATVAGYTLSFLDNVKESDGGLLNGDGTIPLPLINSQYARLRVKLYNVQCNAAGQVISGKVRARYSDKAEPSLKPAWDKPDYTPPTLTLDNIRKIDTLLSSNADMLVSTLKNSANSVGFDVPFGIDKSIGPVKNVIAVTDVTFTPEVAFFQANTWITLPDKPAGFSGIPLSGYNLCMSPDKPLCGDGILYLGQDMDLSKFLTLKGGIVIPGTDTTVLMSKFTYVAFGANGFRKMGIRAGIKPPDLHQVDGSQLEALVNADVNTPDFNDWNAEVTFKDFYVGSHKDYVFSMTDANGKVNKGYYDHSDTKNPDNMPSGYLDTSWPGNTWQGIYFPLTQLKLSGPFAKLNKKDTPITGGVENLIYDNKNGFSGKIFLKNPLTIGDGQLKSWAVSIDQITCTFKNSDFQDANMNGLVGLPLFKKKDGTASTLSYSATIANNPKTNDTDFTFNIVPNNTMYADVWRAQLQLDSSSHISMNYISGAFSASAVLDGQLDLDVSITKLTAAEFTGLGVMTDAPYFAVGKFALNSPQRYIGGTAETGFPLTLTKVDIQAAPNAKGVLPSAIARDLLFTGNMDLTEYSSFSAATSARLRFTVGPSWEDWGYNDFLIDAVSLSGKIGPVGISGELDFLRDDPKWGNGFFGKATLDVGFAAGLKVDGRFGRTLDNAGGFRYFYVSGVVPMPVPIALGSTGLFLKAFRGGIYKNINQVIDNQKGTVTLDPKTGGIGLQAGVIVGTPMKGGLLNMDGTLTIQFDPMQITIDAGAYLMHAGDPPTYANPVASGKALLNINFDQSTVSGSLNLKAKQGLKDFSVEGDVPGGFFLNWSNGNFYIALGNPNGKRVDLSLKAGGETLFNMNSYFLAGSYVPQEVFGSLPPPPYGIPADMLARLHYNPSPFTPTSNGSAIAFGAFAGLGTLDKPIENHFGPFYLDFALGMGFDFTLQQVQACKDYNPPGFNGWYAVAQLYAYLSFALGIDVDLWFYSGRVEAVSGQAAALLQAGMVNPIWLQGSLLLRYRALGGLVKGSCRAHVEYNLSNQCIPASLPIDPFGDKPLIASVLPDGDKNASIMTPLYAEYNFPVETNIDVDSTDKAGNVLKTLRFRIVYKDGDQFRVTPKGAVDPKFAACIGDDSGRLRYGQNEDGDDNYNATFYRNAALAPETDYTLRVGLKALRKEAGGPYQTFKDKDGKPVETTAEVSFRTGKCTNTLTREGNNKTVAYSYPFEGQRYFMKDDGKPTFIEFMAKTCCFDNLASDDKFRLKVRLTPGKTGGFDTNPKAGSILLDASFDGQLHINFDLSKAMLKNNQLYQLEIVRVPTAAYIKEQEAQLAAMKQKANQTKTNMYAATGKSVSAETNPLIQTTAYSLNTNKTGNALAGATMIPASPNNINVGAAPSSSEPLVKSYLAGAGTGSIGDLVNNKANTLIQNYNQQKPVYFEDGTSVVSVDLEKVNKSDKLVRLYDFQSDYDIGKKLEQVLYRYNFQTSKYNTLTEKLATTGFNSLQEEKVVPLPPYTGTLADNCYVIPMGAAENFERYEVRQTDLGHARFLPPLVGLRVNPGSNAWFSQFMMPTLDLMNMFGYLPKPPGQVPQLAMQDQLMRQMVYVNSQFEGPENPLSDNEVDNALQASAPFYQTDQITGQDVMVSAGTTATVPGYGKRRVGVVLDPTPFHQLYANSLFQDAQELLADLKQNLKPLSIDYATAIDKQLKTMCTNMGIDASPTKTFTDRLFVLMTQMQFYDNMKVEDFEDAVVDAVAHTVSLSWFPPANFFLAAQSNCYMAYIITKVKADTKMNDNVQFKALSNINPSGFKNPEDFYYQPLRYQKNSSIEVQVWALPGSVVAEKSKNNPSGVSDFFWESKTNTLSKKAFDIMINTNRTGLFFLKFK